MREWSSKSCHMRLQCTQPPATFNLQQAKWRTSDSSPLQATNLHPPCFFSSKGLLCGPIVSHPSRQICTNASMASCNCSYTLSPSSFWILFCFFCAPEHRKNVNTQEKDLAGVKQIAWLDDSRRDQKNKYTPWSRWHYMPFFTTRPEQGMVWSNNSYKGGHLWTHPVCLNNCI